MGRLVLREAWEETWFPSKNWIRTVIFKRALYYSKIIYDKMFYEQDTALPSSMTTNTDFSGVYREQPLKIKRFSQRWHSTMNMSLLDTALHVKCPGTS